MIISRSFCWLVTSNFYQINHPKMEQPRSKSSYNQHHSIFQKEKIVKVCFGICLVLYLIVFAIYSWNFF